jgi:F-type H+-transporting ATPase subunit delta
MHSASREALKQLREQVSSVLGRFSSTEGLIGLAQELYAVADLLTGQPRLRRRLADSAAAPHHRSGMADTLLEGKISASALSVVELAVSVRWSSAWDLVDALETSGDDVLLAAADSAGVLDDVEDELFRLERILDAQSNLTTLLDQAAVDGGTRAKLLDSVIADKVNQVTLALVRHAVVTQRKRGILLAVDDLIESAGARRERSVARVISAVDLSAQQERALADKLSELYGRRIEVRFAIDPSVRGGLVVRVGDEIIDGSVLSRLNQIRSAFAS